MHSVPAYRTTVEKMLQDLQALENIITAASSLDHDPVAIGIGVQVRFKDDKIVVTLQSCLHNIQLLLPSDKKGQ